MSDLNKKLEFSALGAVVFAVTSLPMLYSYTNKYANAEGDCPMYKTKLFHTFVFFLLNLAVMYYFSKLETGLKVKYSIYGALVFFFLSSTEMYNFTDNFVNTSRSGCPTLTGIVVHAVVYGAVLVGLMSLPKDVCKCTDTVKLL
jgi:hypothetical protein